MQIFSAQKKIDEYREIFDDLIRPNSQFKLDSFIAEEISRTLLKFQSDEHQSAMLDMCDSLQHQVLENDIEMTAKLFESLVT